MAHKITTFESRVVPLPVRDIDTDQIIPARFLKVTDKAGLGELLFSDWRQDPSFVLNQPEAKGAEILLAGDNFGCGSSREHAPWALCAFGFKAVISTSFADIFKSNALKNGLLPVTVPEDAHRALFAAREADPSFTVTIDLAAQTVSLPDGGTASFPVDSFSKHCLLEGIDELGYLLSFSDRIEAHERAGK